MPAKFKTTRRGALMSLAGGAAAAVAAPALTGGAPAKAAAPATGPGYNGLPRTFLWNPNFNTVVDTSQYKGDGPFTIGFSNASQGDGWLGTFYHSIQYGVSQNLDKIAKFIVTDANGDPTKQISDIQDLLNQDIDLLLVNPATADALDRILGRAMRGGTPVVTVARRVETDDNFVSFVTASDTALARMSATWMAETLNGQGRIVLLPGKAGASPAEMRLQAAREVFAQFPGIEVVDTQYTGWSPANGRQIMAAVIQREGADNIDGVWAELGPARVRARSRPSWGAGVASDAIPPHTGGDLNGMYQLAQKHGFPFCGIDYTPSIGAGLGQPGHGRLGRAHRVPQAPGRELPGCHLGRSRDALDLGPDVMLADYVAMDRPGELIMGVRHP